MAYIEDGALVICDDKSGLGESNKQQLDIYAHLLQPVAQSKVGGRYSNILCILNELGKGRVEVIAEYPVGPVDGIRDLIMSKLAEVNAWNEFPAVACSQCQYCLVPGCPIRSEIEGALIVSAAEKQIVPSIPAKITTREDAETSI